MDTRLLHDCCVSVACSRWHLRALSAFCAAYRMCNTIEIHEFNNIPRSNGVIRAAPSVRKTLKASCGDEHVRVPVGLEHGVRDVQDARDAQGIRGT